LKIKKELTPIFCAIWKKDVSALSFTLPPFTCDTSPLKIFDNPEILSTSCSIRMLRCLRSFILAISEVHDILMIDAMNAILRKLNTISDGEDSHNSPGLGISSHKRHDVFSGSKK